jgi:hypothetical protein
MKFPPKDDERIKELSSASNTVLVFNRNEIEERDTRCACIGTLYSPEKRQTKN